MSGQSTQNSFKLRSLHVVAQNAPCQLDNLGKREWHCDIWQKECME